MAEKSSLKSTIAVSLTNYLDAGAIVAGASGLGLWQNYLGLTESNLGWLNAISANAMGAAIGAIIGGFMADKFGRKAIYTYNMLIYMTGVLLVMLSVNFPMLLAGFLVTGISVGVGVPASWTYISESSEINNRGRNICISQMSWGIGPMIITLLATLLAPPLFENGVMKENAGVLFGIVSTVAEWFDVTGSEAVGVFASRILFASLFIVAFIAWNLQRKLEESAEWKAQKEAEARGEAKKTGMLDSFALLFSNKIAITTVTFLAGIYLTWNCVASVMGFFQQHIFETAGGLSNQQSNLLGFVQWAIIVGVTFITAKIVDKKSHKMIYVLGLVVALCPWIMVVLTGGELGMNGAIAFSVLWGIQGGLSVQIFYALWGTELFPAKFRAGAQGLMFFIVRGLCAIWGIVFQSIYAGGEGFEIAAWCMIALLAVSLIVGVIGAPNTRGKSLDQITKERYGDNY